MAEPTKRCTVADLIAALQAMPNKEAFVFVRTEHSPVLWDGTLTQPADAELEYGSLLIENAP